ncbi:MAG: helix-turn-helix transcriptional regulator [Clostridiaceae bacterium]|nr:helix-turn-helix transcriptional regulator [Clostridiaceae bacterium]
MKDRIRKLRKTLDLTQKAFAERIGMKSNTIATYEMGRAIPSDPTINNICKEFGVREEWLREGTGPMFQPVSQEDELEAFLKKLSQDDPAGFKRRLITVMARLDEADWRGLENLARELGEEFAPAPADPVAEMADLKQRVEALEKEEAESETPAPAPVPIHTRSH